VRRFDPLGEAGKELRGPSAVKSLPAAQVHKCLVDRERLDERGKPLHFAAHLTPDRPVFRHVGPYNGRVGAGGKRLEHRHRRAHAIEPCDIAASEHDATGATPDDDRAIGQLGSVALFDSRIKCVAIDMCNREGA